MRRVRGAIAVGSVVVLGILTLLPAPDPAPPPTTAAADDVAGTPGGEAGRPGSGQPAWVPGLVDREPIPAPRGPGAVGRDPADTEAGPARTTTAATTSASDDPVAPAGLDALVINDPSLAEAGDPGPPPTEPAAVTSEGFHVAAGGSEHGRGPVVSYTVEVEPGVGEDLLAVTAAVEEALTDPRSWVQDHTLRRVDDPTEARIRVVLASPATVDRLCAAAGLRTVGRYSCWNGRIAALNSWRWSDGADGFADLTTYRRYLINHEVGHGLGHGHVGCPEAGTLAPVMMQQTMGTGACIANGWPYPDEPSD